MYYNYFKDDKLSALGFGLMRLPVLEDGKTVDSALTEKMVALAIGNGVNYFDTAVPYHCGRSESVIGDILSAYPRDSFFLADKYPGHQHAESYDPASTFEEQLRRCKVEYFDYYLLHNICESSWDVYSDAKWGILEYFVEQRRLGRIRHLGFSSHADVEALKMILDSPYGAEMEFCQIQLNYVDWTLQKAKDKCALLASYGIPIWVMEPVRGGKLASMSPDVTASMRASRPDESTASWAFRWLQDVPGVTMILSGMSSMEQVVDNLKTFSFRGALTQAEKALLDKAVGDMLDSVPCTECRYCTEGCPMGLDIPMLIKAYNDLSLQFSLTPMMRIEALPENEMPSACLQCGACSRICPQKIDIPSVLSSLDELYSKSPKWSEICKVRAAEAARLAAEGTI